MDSKTVAVVVTIAFSVVGVLGDYFLKLASRDEDSLKTPWFYPDDFTPRCCIAQGMANTVKYE